MRKMDILITLVAGGLALAPANLKAQGVEQGLPTNRPPQAGYTREYSKATGPAQTSSMSSNLKASTIIGLPVCNDAGENLGKVQDLIVNLPTHSVGFAIVAYGGALGIGETRVAVPLTDFKWSSQPRELILATAKADFDSASSTPTGGWMAFTGESWMKNVERFYGQPSQTALSRFERQESSSLNEGMEPVRNPAERKGAIDLEQQITPTNPGAMSELSKPTDEALNTKVNSLIRQAMGDKADKIQVTTENGVVKLSGTVPDDTQKKKLVHQIQALPGVTRVEENLTTRSS